MPSPLPSPSSPFPPDEGLLPPHSSVIRSPPSRASGRVPEPATCDLCAHQWVFVLSTGRAGSTTIMEALNALPGVHVGGENQASLEAAAELLGRFTETQIREQVTLDFAGNTGAGNTHALLCSLQQWFRELAGGAAPQLADGLPEPIRALGFKELLSPRSRSTTYDHADRAPPSRHLPVDLDAAAAPRWLHALNTIFPCARIVFNTRSNTVEQAQSAFHKEQGTQPAELSALNELVGRLHAQRGDARSFHLAKEDISADSLTRLAGWLGFYCEFESTPHANDGGSGSSSRYHSDLDGARVNCGGARPHAALGTEVEAALRANVTFGVKHTSSFPERRDSLRMLIKSIRLDYATQPILVAYDGDHVYGDTGSEGERYLHLSRGSAGLGAGRNAIVRHTTTEFVMIIDDDVSFHEGTRVGTLLAHMLRDPALGLAAACYHPNDCYANNLKIEGRRVTSDPVRLGSKSSGLTRAHMVHNLFVARTSVLRAHPWDERQSLMEHETFFAQLLTHGIMVGVDPNVTALHHNDPQTRTLAYKELRHKEEDHLQWLCRNFPRLSVWQMPCTLALGSNLGLVALAYADPPPSHPLIAPRRLDR